MNINIRVIPSAKKELIRQEADVLKVYLTVPALEGKANKALIRCLAEFYGVRKNQIAIIKGLKSRDKTISINVI